MEAASQSAATPAKEQAAPEQTAEVEQNGGFGLMRSLSLGGGTGGNKPKPNVTPGNILQLQRMVGNQAVQRLINAKKSQSPSKPAVQRALAPTVPAYVARDGDGSTAIEEDPYSLMSMQDLGGGAENQIVQVTDLDILDDVGDEENLPDSANEIEGQPSGNDAPPQQPPGNIAIGGHRNNAPQQQPQAQPQPQPQVQPPVQAANNFQRATTPTGPQDTQSRTLIGARDPKTYDQAANLLAEDIGEETGQGSGNGKRTRGLVKTPGIGLKTRYLNRIERRAYRVTIQGGVFKNAQGANLDSQGAEGFTKGNLGGLIFVMSRRGKLYAADMVAEYDAGGLDKSTGRPKPGVLQVIGFHHSSFKAGKAVAGAGEIVVTGGRLTEMSDGSGHYHPDVAKTLQVMREFQKFGVDLTTVRFKQTMKMGRNDPGVIAADFLANGGDYFGAKQTEQQRLNPQPQQQPQQQQPQNGNQPDFYAMKGNNAPQNNQQEFYQN